MGKYATRYTDEELKTIKEQWLQDKKRIDEEYEKRYDAYQWDRDKDYEKHFSNARLRKLFRHAAYLYRALFETSDLKLHPNEKQKIVEIYRRLLSNGYYTRSKIREKEVSSHLGKIISRQYRPTNR